MFRAVPRTVGTMFSICKHLSSDWCGSIRLVPSRCHGHSYVFDFVFSDKSSKVTAFLAETAESVLALKAKLEEATVIVAGLTADNLNAGKAEVLSMLREGVPQADESFGKLVMAAKDASVLEGVESEEVLGLSAAQVKAIKAKYEKKKEPKPKQLPATVSQQLQQLQQQQALLQQHMAALAFPGMGLGLPPPVAAMPRLLPDKERYPCRACRVRGHWKANGQCEPEDIQAHFARISSQVIPGQLTLPAPPGHRPILILILINRGIRRSLSSQGQDSGKFGFGRRSLSQTRRRR